MRQILLPLLVFLALPAAAQAPDPRPSEDWSFTGRFENDLFGDTDQNYTNGIRLSWTSPDLREYRDSKKVPRWFQPYLRKLLFFDNPFSEYDPLVQRNVVFSLGQGVFTPQDIAAFDVIRDDRPYAGWLYGAMAFRKRDPGVLDTLELQLGIVGPLSGAELAQVAVHQIRDLQKPNGWEHQLENEATFGIAYERQWRMLEGDVFTDRVGFDLIPHAGAVLGNAYAYVNAGAEVRLGWNLPPDFGDPIVRPGGVASPPIVWYRNRSLRVYAFFFGDVRAVARDITLDGNTFADSHSIDKRHLVADLAAGVSVVAGRVKVTFTRVVRTREFRGQDGNHHFGSISFSYTF